MPGVLTKVDVHYFCMADSHRRMVNVGLTEGKKYITYVPLNFSNIPLVLTERAAEHARSDGFTDGPICPSP